MNTTLVLLISGQVFSKLAVAMYLLSMTLHIRSLGGGATVLGLLQFLSLLPILLFSPLAAALSDIRGPRRVMVFSDAGRGILLAALALLLLLPTQAVPGLAVAAVLVAAFLVGLGQAAFQPAADTCLPGLVAPSKLGRAVGLRGVSVQTANLAGNAAGGLVFLWFGAAGSTALSAVLFLASAAWEALLPEPWRTAPGQLSVTPDAGSTLASRLAGLLRRMFIQTRIGLRYTLRRPGVAALLGVNTAFHAGFPMLLLALPFLVEFHLGRGPELLGYSFATLLLGGVLGYGGLVWLRTAVGTKLLVRLLVTASCALWVLSFSVSVASPLFAVPFYFLGLGIAGAAAAGLHLLVHTALGVGIPVAFRARVFGLLESTTGAATALGFLTAGPLLDLGMQRLPALVGLLGALGIGLAGVTLRHRTLRNFLSRANAAVTPQAKHSSS